MPITEEPQITKNNTAINQYWCKGEMINVILNANGKVKDIDEFYGQKNLLALNYMNSKGLLKSFWSLSYVTEVGWKAVG